MIEEGARMMSFTFFLISRDPLERDWDDRVTSWSDFWECFLIYSIRVE